MSKPVDVYVVDSVPSGSPPVGTARRVATAVLHYHHRRPGHTRTPAELRFFRPRYGHVRYGHVPILTIIDTLGGDLGRVPFVGGIINFIFAGWTRAATHTADRAGLLVVRDLNHVYSTLVKLAIGPALYDRIDHGALAEQVRQLSDRRHEEAILWFASPFSTTPMGRFEDMLKFSKSPLYHQLRPRSPCPSLSTGRIGKSEAGCQDYPLSRCGACYLVPGSSQQIDSVISLQQFIL